MNTPNPSDYELMDLYRTWWKDSYGTTPNSQATIIAAAWARHVIDCVMPAYVDSEEGQIVDHYMALSAQHAGVCVHHPALTGEVRTNDN